MSIRAICAIRGYECQGYQARPGSYLPEAAGIFDGAGK